MEGFNNLLLKLREVHQQEVEGWQMKLHELSSKKGCDSKRMEELLTRNQHMKEHQRILTENIKTLENRLRAGLCDRCTVTQEVAHRKQQEHEVSQIQNMQHIALLVAEVTNLKKDNIRLKDEIRNLRASLKVHTDPSLSNCTTDIKSSRSPDLSPLSGPITLLKPTTSRTPITPTDGDVQKSESEQKIEEAEHRLPRTSSRSSFPLSTLSQPSLKTEARSTCVREGRSQSGDGLASQPSIPPHSQLLKNSSSSVSGDETSVNYAVSVPAPCRPKPIKNSTGSFPWMLSESDWASMAAANSLLVQPSLKRFPNQIQQVGPFSLRRPVFGTSANRQSNLAVQPKEPTIVIRMNHLSESVGTKTKAKNQEREETPPIKSESVCSQELQESYDGPLDLSEKGKSDSSQMLADDLLLSSQSWEKREKTTDKDMRPIRVSPSSSAASPSSSEPQIKQEEESTNENRMVIIKKDQQEEANGKTDQKNDKKIPVFTSLLHPVVVLETLNSALQKQESRSTNGKSSWPVADPGSSSEEQEEEDESIQENSRSCKRKRPSDETEYSRHSPPLPQATVH